MTQAVQFSMPRSEPVKTEPRFDPELRRRWWRATAIVIMCFGWWMKCDAEISMDILRGFPLEAREVWESDRFNRDDGDPKRYAASKDFAGNRSIYPIREELRVLDQNPLGSLENQYLAGFALLAAGGFLFIYKMNN